jgi:hypothetical protein
LAFAAFFVLAIVLINPTKQENNTETKAEFMVVVEWPSDLDDDVDTYVEDPSGNLVAFMRREEGLMHLDRDDLGHRNDSVLTEFGVIEYTENRELVTLRGIAKGEYIVNVHLYMKRSTATEIPVVIKLEKLNPYKTVTIKRVVLRVTGDEETAFRFTLDNEGKVVDVNELPKKLAVKGQQTPL